MVKFDAITEAEFREDYSQNAISTARIGIIAGLILFAIFGILDSWSAPLSKHSIWVIRYAFACPFIIIALALTWTRIYRRYFQFIQGLFGLVLGASLLLMLAVIKEQEPGFGSYHFGLLLVLMWTYTLSRLYFFNALFTALLLMAGYEFVAIVFQGALVDGASGPRFAAFVDRNFFLLAANVVGILACGGFEYYARLVFQQHKSVIAEKEKSEQFQRQMLHSAKLVSIGELAAGMAHEINNPLAILRTNVDIQERVLPVEQSLQEQFKTYFDRQRRAIDRIANIVDRLRIYARNDGEALEAVNVHEAVQDVIELLSPIYSKVGIRFETDFHAEEACFNGNPSRFQQALMNLFSNAKDALEGCADPVIRCQTFNVDRQIILEVIDNGSGIKKEHLDRICDTFFTTKPAGKGSGLGMGVVLTILEEIGGSLSFESKLRFGTRMTLSIPYAEGVRPLAAEKGMPESFDSALGSLRGSVLVVDDEPDIRECLEEILREFGLKVDSAPDGEEALAKLDRSNYDLVITDLQMPRMNGETLCQKIREMAAQPRIVVITGGINNASFANGDGPLSKLIDGYIGKPFDTMQVYQSVRRQLEPGLAPGFSTELTATHSELA